MTNEEPTLGETRPICLFVTIEYFVLSPSWGLRVIIDPDILIFVKVELWRDSYLIMACVWLGSVRISFECSFNPADKTFSASKAFTAFEFLSGKAVSRENFFLFENRCRSSFETPLIREGIKIISQKSEAQRLEPGDSCTRLKPPSGGWKSSAGVPRLSPRNLQLSSIRIYFFFIFLTGFLI